MKTSVAVRSLHPRLRFNRRSVIKALGVLDENRDRLTPTKGRARRLPRAQSSGPHRAAAAPLAPSEPEGPRELSVVFLTDAALARLHGDFLGDSSETDVITFPGQPGLGTAGEICISVDAALRVAGDRRSAPGELTLYLVHGWLHLAGHRDAEPAARRAMRRAEALALRILRSAGTLPSFTL